MNATRLHETALHHAAKASNAEMIELLVEFGANLYAKDKLEKKPSDYTRLGTPSALCLQLYESEYAAKIYSRGQNWEEMVGIRPLAISRD